MTEPQASTPAVADSEPVEPRDPEAPKDLATVDPAQSGPLGRWPWVVTALLAGTMVILFIFFLDRAWDYVIAHSEDAEMQDWDQLSTLFGRVDALVTLVLGAILGVGVGAAKGAGDTKAAAAAADANQKEAVRQHATATTNARVAAGNKAVVRTVRHDLRRATTSLRKVHTAVEVRKSDGSRGLAPQGDAAPRAATPAPEPGQPDRPVDPLLSEMAAEAGALADELDRKYS